MRLVPGFRVAFLAASVTTALVPIAGCALSHEIGEGSVDDFPDPRGRDGGPDAGRDLGRPRDIGPSPVDGGPRPAERDLGLRDAVDLGPGGSPADPEVFEDEVERYVELERRARERWCPCEWMTAPFDFDSEEACRDHMFHRRECFRDAVAGPAKNEDLRALRCFNDAAERVYFPCVARIDDCSALHVCGMELAPAVGECELTDAVAMCFTIGG